MHSTVFKCMSTCRVNIRVSTLCECMHSPFPHAYEFCAHYNVPAASQADGSACWMFNASSGTGCKFECRGCLWMSDAESVCGCRVMSVCMGVGFRACAAMLGVCVLEFTHSLGQNAHVHVLIRKRLIFFNRRCNCCNT